MRFYLAARQLEIEMIRVFGNLAFFGGGRGRVHGRYWAIEWYRQIEES